MTVVLLDAYSTSNVGDAELVRLSVKCIEERLGESPVVFATDPDSFTGNSRYILKPLSRAAWRARAGASRAAWIASEGVGIAALAIIPLLPSKIRRLTARLAARASRRLWLQELSAASYVFGVGGGYLGDRYLRESIVTVLTYRFAQSIGAHVETMPLSVSSANSRLLRVLLARTRGVQWRAREGNTHAILSSLGLSPSLVPDLAWLDSGEQTSANGRSGLTVAPVGSDFYVRATDEPKVWKSVVQALATLSETTEVRLVPMHSYSTKLGDGGDDRACELLANLLRHHNPNLSVTVLAPGDYQAVRNAMAASEFAICERLHAALAATTTGTPVQILSYEPKHKGVMALAGLDALCDSQVTAYAIESAMIEARAQRQREVLESELL